MADLIRTELPEVSDTYPSLSLYLYIYLFPSKSPCLPSCLSPLLSLSPLTFSPSFSPSHLGFLQQEGMQVSHPVLCCLCAPHVQQIILLRLRVSDIR
jgi:hypothetical protein